MKLEQMLAHARQQAVAKYGHKCTCDFESRTGEDLHNIAMTKLFSMMAEFEQAAEAEYLIAQSQENTLDAVINTTAKVAAKPKSKG
jgi:hypothetical protein